MPDYAEFLTADGAVVRVESAGSAAATENQYGMQPVGRPPAAQGVARAADTFEQALSGVRVAAESALAVFRNGTLKPDEIEIEFGIKLSAEAGALIAKTAADAHLTVKLTWSPERSAAGHQSS